jgi:hypothetical protein
MPPPMTASTSWRRSETRARCCAGRDDVARGHACLAHDALGVLPRERLAKPARHILAALQTLAPFLGGVTMAGRLRHLGFALRNLALGGRGESFMAFDGPGMHVVDVRPKLLVGLGIAKLRQ